MKNRVNKPDKKKRQQYLKYLRAGMPDENDPTKSLTDIACKYRDQTIQKAAIGGLVKFATPQAVLGIAKRLLDPWGTETIKYCIKSLEKVAENGGTLILSSTLLIDHRFINEKLEILAEIEDCKRRFKTGAPCMN